MSESRTSGIGSANVRISDLARCESVKLINFGREVLHVQTRVNISMAEDIVSSLIELSESMREKAYALKNSNEDVENEEESVNIEGMYLQ